MLDKPLCIIPARGGSKRFPGKNIALFAGKPLIAHAIETALESEVFHTVLVTSDDEETLDIARKYRAVLALKRPAELAADDIQVKTVCKYLLEYFTQNGKNYKEFAVILTTNPLRSADDIRKAYKLFKNKHANYLLSLAAFSHPPQRAVKISDGFVKPFLGVEYMKRTQMLEPLYRHDGSIIFAKTEAFLKEGEFYGTRVVPFIIPSERSVDIDTPLDLAWAEFILENVLCEL